MEGPRRGSSAQPRRGSQQSQTSSPTVMAQLQAQLQSLQVDREGLTQRLHESDMVMRLLQSSLTGKIRARDDLIVALFEAAEAAGVSSGVMEPLQSRFAKLKRQTAGMEGGVTGCGAEDDEAEQEPPGLPKPSPPSPSPSVLPSAAAVASEMEALRQDKARLELEQAQLFAELEEQHRRVAELTAQHQQQHHQNQPHQPHQLPQEREAADSPEGARMLLLPAQLERVAASCAALSEDLGGVKRAVRSELEAGVTQVMERARLGLQRYAAAQDGELGKLRRLWEASEAERRRLFNLVQELRGNIRVLVRPRPLLPAAEGEKKGEEEEEGKQQCMRLDVTTGEVSLAYGRKLKQFEFDQVFGLEASQAEVYEAVAPVISSVLDGYNACVLAFGQTGAGKTHTMQGPALDPGVNVRALRELFERVAQRKAEACAQDEVSISVLEIYNETIQDLLAGTGAGTVEEAASAAAAAAAPTTPSSVSSSSKKLEIKQGPQGMYVTDLTVVPVASLGQVLALLELGERSRATAATNMNDHSSRSHLVLTVYLQSRNAVTGVTTRSKLSLIDLAGSERVRRSGAEGQALKEAQNINKSLSALGDVIQARLAKAQHVPFRNSTLSYLLQDSLSGDAKVLMLVCVSPRAADAEESSSSLQFACRVRRVELGKATRQVVSAASPIATAAAGAGAGAAGADRGGALHSPTSASLADGLPGKIPSK